MVLLDLLYLVEVSRLAQTPIYIAMEENLYHYLGEKITSSAVSRCIQCQH